MATPFLSIVIPAYNEERRIVATLDQVVKYLDRQSYTWEVLVVDDGSSDSTAALAHEYFLAEHPVRVESVPHGGKGWAVRHGMLAARGAYRFMCDADLAMPIEQLGAFLQHIEQGYDVVIGSRQIGGARRFDEPWSRHIMGRVFNWSVRVMAINHFDDTQCGFKCFRAAAAKELFSQQRTKGFGFDVEILYMAVRRQLSVLEIPIDWYYQESSKVRPVLDSFLMLRDAAMVRLHGMRGIRKS